MKIWVDADACPKVIKEILYRAVGRTGIHMTLVANQYLTVPPSPLISVIQVPAGFDVADHKIVELCTADDLIITADIPLAALVVAKGACALNPRGELYDAGNIGPILSMRDFMDAMRGGVLDQAAGGPRPFAAAAREKFANALDRYIQRFKV